jgi:serine/threonine protein kinase
MRATDILLMTVESRSLMDESVDSILMEYMPDGDLHSLICKLGNLPVRDCKRFIRVIAFAMDRLWQLGMVHLDLKSLNLLLDRRYIPFGDNADVNVKVGLALLSSPVGLWAMLGFVGLVMPGLDRSSVTFGWFLAAYLQAEFMVAAPAGKPYSVHPSPVYVVVCTLSDHACSVNPRVVWVRMYPLCAHACQNVHHSLHPHLGYMPHPQLLVAVQCFGVSRGFM